MIQIKSFLVFIILVVLVNIELFGQYNSFHIGIGVMDFDSVLYPSRVPSGTDPNIGLDNAYLEDLADLGFNLILPYHYLLKNGTKWVDNTPSLAFLDRAQNYNLDVILSCPEIALCRNLTAQNEVNLTKISNALNYYGSHPAVIGWHIMDEPSSPHFDKIDSVACAIDLYHNSDVRFSSLYPNNATYNQLTVNREYIMPHPTSIQYENYIVHFITETNPNFLSVDHYPIANGGVSNYFLNLDVVARNAILYGLPYWVMFSPLGASGNGKTREELNYVIYSNLVYGAKGLFYWPRETQFGCLGYEAALNTNNQNGFDRLGLISDSVLNYMGGLHARIIAHGDLLYSLELKSIFHTTANTGIVINQTTTIPSRSNWANFKYDSYAKEIFDVNHDPIEALSGSTNDNIVISFLENSGTKYFWIFNKSLYDNANIKLNFNTYLDLHSVLDGEDIIGVKDLSLNLGKGEAILYETDIRSSVEVCAETFYNGVYPNVISAFVDIGGSSCDVRYYNGAKINYYANKISILENVSIYEGSYVSFNSESNYLKSEQVEKVIKKSSKNNDLSKTIKLFPNPSDGYITIDSKDANCNILSITFYNMLGEVLDEIDRINLSLYKYNKELLPGIYICEIKTYQGTYLKKIMVK